MYKIDNETMREIRSLLSFGGVIAGNLRTMSANEDEKRFDDMTTKLENLEELPEE